MTRAALSRLIVDLDLKSKRALAQMLFAELVERLGDRQVLEEWVALLRR